MSSKPGLVGPALIGGGTLGFLAGIPGLSVLNFCTCCSMAIVGGLVASWIWSRRCASAGLGFRVGDGVLAGLVAGLVWGLVSAIVSSAFTAAIGQPIMRGLLEWAQQMPDLPAQSQDQIETALDALDEQQFSVLQLVWSIFTSLIAGSIFATLGGLIGGAIFKSELPPPPPASVVSGGPSTGGPDSGSPLGPSGSDPGRTS